MIGAFLVALILFVLYPWLRTIPAPLPIFEYLGESINAICTSIVAAALLYSFVDFGAYVRRLDGSVVALIGTSMTIGELATSFKGAIDDAVRLSGAKTDQNLLNNEQSWMVFYSSREIQEYLHSDHGVWLADEVSHFQKGVRESFTDLLRYRESCRPRSCGANRSRTNLRTCRRSQEFRVRPPAQPS